MQVSGKGKVVVSVGIDENRLVVHVEEARELSPYPNILKTKVPAYGKGGDQGEDRDASLVHGRP
jgi:hypothetical protein